MRRLRALAATGGAVGVAVGVAATGGPATTGCTTHQCDGDIVCIDSTGSMKTVSSATDCMPVITGGTPIPFYNLGVDDIISATGEHELTWVTSSLLGPWLDFPGQRNYVIQFPPGFAGHVPDPPVVTVSSDNELGMAPDASHANFTTASGQLAEFTNVGPTQATVFNDTCVDYGLVIEFHAFVQPTDAAGAATPGMAGTSTPSVQASTPTRDGAASE